ncbi:hypothetical protein P4O66_000110 [Electrophorus voltai]|uniref:Ferritin n=1 Tax=Electrophorus voltai TaxID=2609070 RepID=A0AAD9E6I6_9TELE|nr:hypothetical protein P4O66_000110 [Electrophorus voltai]
MNRLYPSPVVWVEPMLKDTVSGTKCPGKHCLKLFPPADQIALIMAKKMQSAVKHSLHFESEAAINKLINIKLTASYTHVSLGMYSDRHDVALPNFSRFFLELSEKEREQAESLLEYQNLRGGRVLLQNIALCDFLESHFLLDSHETIKKLGDHISILMRLRSSEPNGQMGEYLFDRHTL